MKRRFSVTLVVLALTGALAGNSLGGEWKSLMPEKGLEGWQAVDGPAGSWKAEDGVLFCTGKGGGWLSTTKEYKDFELELEFRVPKNGNSGVFFRAPHEGNPAFAGMEIQVLDDAGDEYKELKPSQYTGSLYGVEAAKPRVTKPAGEWQTMAIRCEGNRVQVKVNGTQVVDTDITKHPEAEEMHPGLKRRQGYLGLQNHGSRLDYRNIRVRELP